MNQKNDADIELLQNGQLATRLLELLKWCDSASWAVAWVTNATQILDAALKQADKFEQLVVGTADFISDPLALARLKAVPAAVALLPTRTPLFHAKLYLFQKGEEFRAVVGSHNLTRGAMERNSEASILVAFHAEHTSALALKKIVREAYLEGVPIEGMLDDYTSARLVIDAQRRQLQRSIEETTNLKPKPDGGQPSALKPLAMSWGQYTDELQERYPQALRERLLALQYLGGLFAKRGAFAKMTTPERLAVAGLTRPTMARQRGTNLNFFGYMGRVQSLHILASSEAKQGLSRALSKIPIEGSVHKWHYEEFLKDLLSVWDEGQGGNPIGAATRMLALRRPDVFVSQAGSAGRSLRQAIGVTPTVRRLDRYWDEVIAPLQSTAWWTAPEPKKSAPQVLRDIWHSRMALLDTLYFKGELT